MNMTARVPEGPRDVKTVFALLNGKNVEFEGARVRSFQLPPKSSGLSVSQLAKRSTYCAMHGDLLEEYYFNQPPANVMCQQALVANQHVGRCLIDQVVPEPEHCAISECDEYHSCSEGEDGDWVLPWQVCASGSSRGLNATHVLPLRESASGKIREQALHHVSLQCLSELQTMQGEGSSDQRSDQSGYLLPAEGLPEDMPSGSTSATRRRPGSGRWRPRSHHRQGGQHPVSVERSEGHDWCAPARGSSSGGGTKWYRIDTLPAIRQRQQHRKAP